MIEFQCQNCQTFLNVPVQIAGKRATCPNCNQVTNVPTSSISQSAGNGITFPDPGNPPASPMQSNTGQASHPAQNVHGGGSQQSPPHTNQGNVSQQYAQQRPAGVMGSSTQTPAPPPSRQLPNTSMPDVRTPSTPSLASGSTQIGAETESRKLYLSLTEQISHVFVGQDELVMGTLVALFSSGHVLIESVPGLGKTLFVRTLGKVLGCDFGRIQFTADLMPSDITGAPIYNMKTQEFRFHPGPVFTQLLLADEINRSPAKTHAALLEIMQEYRVTIDGVTHKLDRPFLVMATQNPIESEGTYNLPEAQLDRFMFKLIMDYPSEQEESRILTMHSTQKSLDEQLQSEVQTISNAEQINRITREMAAVRIETPLVNYINKIVRMTRQWPQFHIGASPRAGIALMQGARTLASFYGRDYAIPDDVIQIALPALRHRVVLTAEAEVEGQDVNELLTAMIRTIEVPRLQ